MSIQIPGLTTVVIPNSITVHLGAPDENAENVTVSFIDYIKNVASSELYPTWPEVALRANIHAIISIALNRIFTEWYKARGYNFDITNSTQYDQYFVKNRGIFDRIDNIVNNIFDEYIVRSGSLSPLYAQFCDGRISQCNGMYQWGTVELASQGYTPIDIIKYYYGDDVTLVTDTTVGDPIETFPGTPLQYGDSGQYIQLLQILLNTISTNFPAIPKVPVDAVYGPSMINAVETFQLIFDLPTTGIVDKSTWYKIRNIHTAVTNLAELTSQGISISEIPTDITEETGEVVPRVQLVQYFLNVLSAYYNTVPPVDIDGILGIQTRTALLELQKTMGIPQTGLIDEETYNVMYNSVIGVLNTLPPSAIALPSLIFPGIVLERGSEGPNVYIIQQILSYISTILTELPTVDPDGIYGPATENAIIEFQNYFGIDPTGIVNEYTWNKLVENYRNLRFGEYRNNGQFSGDIIS
ncbi:peptidoglycan-binding protein [Sedimentibacter sp. MB31-C6]|uniref:peptidoglycan-binding protein n=1 Tax=Sedimentibacter sp. MB31-C6 TaxID=3109366 RepID=UPI002DDCE63F|nr:peptidoglycan-binding protein [Sedimentibacter sp. MB36-C1]WSI03785.1 peptidoglycan-binding protein [Sedimentibacter sp. MB36-C1]